MILATGCFAAITPGHIGYLERAAKFGNLFVAAASAEVCWRLKGHRAIPDRHRRAMLSALPFVAGVMIQNDVTPAGIIQLLRPDIWVKGSPYTVESLADTPEGRAVLSYGGRIVVVETTPSPTTTELLSCWKTGCD